MGTWMAHTLRFSTGSLEAELTGKHHITDSNDVIDIFLGGLNSLHAVERALSYLART
jgi:hypothetical protein